MYNQPFSQPPGMFGAQSAMAQMQSAPSLPAGNPGAREYFNYSMGTLSNATMPRAMMPQGISSLVPQYQFGGGVGYSGDVGIDWGAVAAAMDAAQAQADAAAAADAAADAAAVDSITQPSVQSDVGIPATSAPAPGFDPGTSYETSNPATSGGSAPGFDPGTSYATSPSTLGAAATSVDPAVIAAAQSIDKALADAEDAQMQQLAGDLNALMGPMQDEAARGTLSRDEGNQLSANQAVMEMTQPSGGSTPVGMQPSYSDQPQQSLSGSPPPNLLQSALNLLDEYAMPSRRGPGILAAGLGPFSIVPTIVTRGAEALGLEAGPFYGDQGGFETDLAALSIPTGIKFLRTPPPEIGDDGEPDLGDPEQAAETITQPAYVQPVYQTYAGLGLPSVSPIPPLRRVTVPISSFVV